MDQSISTMAPLERFIRKDENSWFTETALERQRSKGQLLKRVEELKNSGREGQHTVEEAWQIQTSIKYSISDSGELATHDGSEAPMDIKVPGVIVVTPDGGTFQTRKKRPNVSLSQSLTRDILAFRNLEISGREPFSLFANSLFPLGGEEEREETSHCGIYGGLEDIYGKTTWQELRQSASNYGSYQLIVDVLGIYASDIESEDKIRILTPLTSNDLVRIWY
jgi:hypothetical protein